MSNQSPSLEFAFEIKIKVEAGKGLEPATLRKVFGK